MALLGSVAERTILLADDDVGRLNGLYLGFGEMTSLADDVILPFGSVAN